jgi:hypothetical protein
MYQQTHSATAMAFVQVAYITPFLLMPPIARVMVDRYNRKAMMMVSDIASGLATFSVLILFTTGHLQYWYIYASSPVAGIGTTFQWPAYSAVISIMIPKEQYGRANGMMSLIEAGPGVLAPLLAGALIPIVGIGGILVFDAVTFGFTVLAPMLLARIGQNTVVLGSVQSAMSVGMVVGGIAMSAWGGFKSRVRGVLLGWIFSSLGASIVFGLGRSLQIWIPAVFFGGLFVPLVNGSNQAIWQAKVAPDLQGRVFSARWLIAWFTNPISPIIGGTLADFVLEPAMKVPNSALAQIFGSVFGTGPGAGMSLLIVICGVGGFLVGLAGYFIPAIRDAESVLPDHDALPAGVLSTA